MEACKNYIVGVFLNLTAKVKEKYTTAFNAYMHLKA